MRIIMKINPFLNYYCKTIYCKLFEKWSYQGTCVNLNCSIFIVCKMYFVYQQRLEIFKDMWVAQTEGVVCRTWNIMLCFIFFVVSVHTVMAMVPVLLVLHSHAVS